jgi:diguanylate cyclase (GGDEF)-like protein
MDIGGLDEGAMNLVGRIRRQSDPFTTPIVVITDSQDPELAWRAFAAGAGDVVRKPLDSGEVAARVGRLLQAKMKIESLQAECRRLEKLSVTDPLTGLSNRRHFVQLAEQEVERSRRYNRKPVAVVMIDIDDFKHFNDTYGHRHGDLILREIAQILRTRTRITDIVSRFGGEEFAIALPETNLDGALVVAENLRRAVEKADFFGREYKELVTISLGVSAFDPRQGGDIDAAILRADKAMYRAKEAGKNRTEVDETVRKAS